MKRAALIFVALGLFGASQLDAQARFGGQLSFGSDQDLGVGARLHVGLRSPERLARIVVSDIVLYSKEKFEAAVAAGNVLEAMQPEIAEGRSLFTARVDPSIQEMRDFLIEELLRVAEAKGKP